MLQMINHMNQLVPAGKYLFCEKWKNYREYSIEEIKCPA